MGKYIHTLKFTHSGTIYTATIEDDNDDVKYKSIVEMADLITMEQSTHLYETNVINNCKNRNIHQGS